MRQYLPRSADFSAINEAMLRWIEARLNNRPRKTLRYRTLLDVFAEAYIKPLRIAVDVALVSGGSAEFIGGAAAVGGAAGVSLHIGGGSAATLGGAASAAAVGGAILGGVAAAGVGGYMLGTWVYETYVDMAY